MKLFIYGGSGTVGQVLIQNLLKAGHEVFAGSRNPENQTAQEALTWIKVDSATDDGLSILQQVERVFLMAPPGYSDQYGVLNPWIIESKRAGIKKIVLMTAMGVENAPPEAPFRKLELALIDSSVPYTILRPNWFMQNFTTFWIPGILKDRKIYYPGGDVKASFVDAHDIADVASVVLTSGESASRELAVTGPAALSHQTIAEIISAATQVEITYDDIDPDQFESGLVAAGLPADYAAFLVQIAGALKAGHAAPVTSTVREITGTEARNFEDFAKSNQSKWLQT